MNGAAKSASTSARLPSLDGLRAIAVLAVVVGHLYLRRPAESGLGFDLIGDVPRVGVELFFAISGFLITHLLLRERERTGRIDLRRFYARRAVRLWPALWVYVGVVGILAAFSLVDVNLQSTLSSLLFVADYDHGPSPALFHLWSLAVEEQFYLLWPLTFLLLGRRRSRPALVLAIVAAPFIRVAGYFLAPSHRGELLYQFHGNYDILACGCLLAFLLPDERFQALVNRWATWLTVGSVIALVGSEIVTYHLGGGYALTVDDSLRAITLTAIVAVGVLRSDSRAGRVLNTRLLVHLGVISYSVYLWQQLFTAAAFGIFKPWPISLVMSLVAGEASYRLVERPFNGLRRRLQPPVPREAASATPAALAGANPVA